jgi:RNA polymerase sigma-70 factor, ECF subfamily
MRPIRATIFSVELTNSIASPEHPRDERFSQALREFGAPLQRLAHAYEADPEKRRDLSQEIHLQLWRSLEHYDSRCSLRTWIYRVAHNTAASYLIRERRHPAALVTLEELEQLPAEPSSTDKTLNLARLAKLIQGLKPLDRQIIVSYLEDLDAASIADITGLSPANVSMRIHRIKRILAQRFHQAEKKSE